MEGVSRPAQATRAAVRFRRRAGPLSLDAGGVPRLALRPKAGNVSTRFGQAVGATVGEGGPEFVDDVTEYVKRSGGKVLKLICANALGVGPLAPRTDGCKLIRYESHFERKLQICPRRSHELGVRITPPAGQPVYCGGTFRCRPPARDQRGQRFVVSRPAGKGAHDVRQGQPDRPVHQRQPPQPPHGLRGARSRKAVRGAIGTSLTSPTAVSAPRASGLERPRGRSRPHAEREGFRPGPFFGRKACKSFISRG